MHIKHLPLAHELASNGGANLFVAVRTNIGQHGVAFLGRGGQGGGFADARHRHFQGSRNGCGAHGQHVHIGAHFLQGLFVLHPKALFLINNDQTKVLKAEVLGEQAVRTNDNIHCASAHALHDFFGFLGSLKTRKRLDPNREPGKTLVERLIVLLRQQRGGHQNGHLLAVLDRLEGSPHGNLSLAVAHIAGDQPVHGDFLLHVGLDLVDGHQLIWRLNVREGFFKLSLPRGVWPERMPLRRHARRIQPDQLAGNLLNRLACLGLGGCPVGTTHL